MGGAGDIEGDLFALRQSFAKDCHARIRRAAVNKINQGDGIRPPIQLRQDLHLRQNAAPQTVDRGGLWPFKQRFGPVEVASLGQGQGLVIDAKGLHPRGRDHFIKGVRGLRYLALANLRPSRDQIVHQFANRGPVCLILQNRGIVAFHCIVGDHHHLRSLAESAYLFQSACQFGGRFHIPHRHIGHQGALQQFGVFWVGLKGRLIPLCRQGKIIMRSGCSCGKVSPGTVRQAHGIGICIFGGGGSQNWDWGGRKRADQCNGQGQTRHSRLLWRKATLKRHAMKSNAGLSQTAPHSMTFQ